MVRKDELAIINDGKGDLSRESPSPALPWKAILSSRAVIVYTITRVSTIYAFTMMTTKLPLFLNEVLHVSMTKVS